MGGCSACHALTIALSSRSRVISSLCSASNACCALSSCGQRRGVTSREGESEPTHINERAHTQTTMRSERMLHSDVRENGESRGEGMAARVRDNE
eukprot:6951644-Prymnesium_polylepis.2